MGAENIRTEEEVKNLMLSSKDSKGWNENCSKVKLENGGEYPSFWEKVIVAPQLINKVLNGSENGEIEAYDLLPRELIEIPLSGDLIFPHLAEGQKVICVWSKELKEEVSECPNLEQMKTFWKAYMKGMALTCKFYIEG
jgi:hypothetical protein